jgi:hypothetical protein
VKKTYAACGYFGDDYDNDRDHNEKYSATSVKTGKAFPY